MKVKDLIKILSEYDSEMEVLGTCTDPSDYTYVVEIEVGEGSPYDSNGYSGIDGSEDVEANYDETNTYIGPRVILIYLGDV